MHHQRPDPAQQGRGARHAGLLRREPAVLVAAGQGGVLGGEHVAVPQHRPGGPPGGQPQRGPARREILAWPRKLPDSLRAGDIPACLTTAEEDSYWRRSPVSARIAARSPATGRLSRRSGLLDAQLGLAARSCPPRPASRGPGVLQVRQRAAGPAQRRAPHPRYPPAIAQRREHLAGRSRPAACRPSRAARRRQRPRTPHSPSRSPSPRRRRSAPAPPPATPARSQSQTARTRPPAAPGATRPSLSRSSCFAAVAFVISCARRASPPAARPTPPPAAPAHNNAAPAPAARSARYRPHRSYPPSGPPRGTMAHAQSRACPDGG